MIVFVAMTVHSISFSCGVFMPIGLTYFFFTRRFCLHVCDCLIIDSCALLWLSGQYCGKRTHPFPILSSRGQTIKCLSTSDSEDEGDGWALTPPHTNFGWVIFRKSSESTISFFGGGLYTSKQISGFYSPSWGVCLDFVEALGEKSLARYKVLKTS